MYTNIVFNHVAAYTVCQTAVLSYSRVVPRVRDDSVAPAFDLPDQISVATCRDQELKSRTISFPPRVVQVPFLPYPLVCSINYPAIIHGGFSHVADQSVLALQTCIFGRYTYIHNTYTNKSVQVCFCTSCFHGESEREKRRKYILYII